MDSIRATIVIPCYNQAHYLPDAIESALNQTVKCDVIVVDDGSPDDVYSVAKRYPVTYIRQQNKGLSGARNTGIRCANTEWILPLDADDKIAPNMIEKCLETEADIIGVAQETFGDYVAGHIFQPEPKYEDFLHANQINCCSIFRKAMWEDVGGYDENMKLGLEDWQFWLKATYSGYTVATISEILFFYRKHGESMISGVHKNFNKVHSMMMESFNEFKKNMHKM